MAAWARVPNSFSSLPTTTSPSSSSPSSSASLPPLTLLDLTDELWFYRSVLPLPSISIPCLPHFLPSSPPDTSTLIAQCMFDDDLACPAKVADPEENGYLAYNYGYSSMSESDDNESYSYPGYSHSATVEDEEAYHYYTAASDWDDEDTYHGYPALSDCEDDEPLHLIKEDQLPIYPQEQHGYLDPEDALSGIYDVAILLKDQHAEEVKEKHLSVPSLRFKHEAVPQMSALPNFQVSSGKDQADMKESLKLWAHAVALTLPWKAVAQARPLL